MTLPLPWLPAKAIKIIPEAKITLSRWLADLSRNIATIGPGAAFLDVQITNLENKCTAMLRARIGQQKANAGKQSCNMRRRRVKEQRLRSVA
jgi:hypothetical protein